MALNTRLQVFFCICLASLLPGLCTALTGCSEPQIQKTDMSLSNLVTEAISTSDERRRVSALSEATTVAIGLDVKEIMNLPDNLIDNLISLLEDRNDAVKFYTASVLGSMGSRAKRAVPALQQAWKLAQPVPGSGIIGPSLSPAEAFEAAIVKIKRDR
jgi:hypothetical protein